MRNNYGNLINFGVYDKCGLETVFRSQGVFCKMKQQLSFLVLFVVSSFISVCEFLLDVAVKGCRPVKRISQDETRSRRSRVVVARRGRARSTWRAGVESS